MIEESDFEDFIDKILFAPEQMCGSQPSKLSVADNNSWLQSQAMNTNVTLIEFNGVANDHGVDEYFTTTG